MAQGTFKTELSSLQDQNPSIKLYFPDSPDYEILKKTFIVTPAKPAVIARPQSVEDVQALVRVCVDKDLDFAVRTGGHNCVGRALVQDALLIDMRDVSYVRLSEDKKTAKIGGGTLALPLLEELGKHGLITASPTIASVGYIGWSTLGGYGPFSSIYGPGVDQIVGAKLVNAKGEVIDAGKDLLAGIRGAGPAFGVISELTIKVFPLNEMLVSTLIFESSDMLSTWSSLITGIDSLIQPPQLKIQLFATDFPGMGKVLGAIATWVGDDHEEGHKFIDKIVGFGNCVVNMTEPKTTAKYVVDNEKMVTYGVYGRSYTLSLKKWTPTAVRVLAEYSTTVPGGNTMISFHSLTSPQPDEASVFGAREDHHMLEIVSMTSDPALKDEADNWGQGLLRALQEQDADNVLDSAYISLLDQGDTDLKKIYGKHLETLISLKKKYDPENVFKHATPKITV